MDAVLNDFFAKLTVLQESKLARLNAIKWFWIFDFICPNRWKKHRQDDGGEDEAHETSGTFRQECQLFWWVLRHAKLSWTDHLKCHLHATQLCQQTHIRQQNNTSNRNLDHNRRCFGPQRYQSFQTRRQRTILQSGFLSTVIPQRDLTNYGCWNCH